MRSFGKLSAGNHIQRQLVTYLISQRIQIEIHASNGQHAHKLLVWLEMAFRAESRKTSPQICNWQHEQQSTSNTDDTNLQFEGRNESYTTISPRCDSTVMMRNPLQAFNISVDQITHFSGAVEGYPCDSVLSAQLHFRITKGSQPYDKPAPSPLSETAYTAHRRSHQHGRL